MMMTTVIQTMNRPVPRNRAIRSDSRPKASGSYSGSRRRRGGCGWPRRSRARAPVPAEARSRVSRSRSGAIGGLLGHVVPLVTAGGLPVLVELLLPPVLGQHVVEDVVHGDRAEQRAALVDDGRRDHVVR